MLPSLIGDTFFMIVLTEISQIIGLAVEFLACTLPTEVAIQYYIRFLDWGFVKDQGCANRASNMKETKEQAREAFDEIDVLMLKRVWADIREYL